jgi:hypothetical protein
LAADRPADPATVAFPLPTGYPEPPAPPLSRRARRAAEQAEQAARVARGEQDDDVTVPPGALTEPVVHEPPAQVAGPAGPGGDESDDWVELPSFARAATDGLRLDPQGEEGGPGTGPGWTFVPSTAEPASPPPGRPVEPAITRRPGDEPSAAVDLAAPAQQQAPASASGGGPLGLFPAHQPVPVVPSVPPMAAPAPPTPAPPLAPPLDQVAGLSPSVAGSPDPAADQDLSTARIRQTARPRDRDDQTRTTSSIPVIRPPVQVRRPDDPAPTTISWQPPATIVPAGSSSPTGLPTAPISRSVPVAEPPLLRTQVTEPPVVGPAPVPPVAVSSPAPVEPSASALFTTPVPVDKGEVGPVPGTGGNPGTGSYPSGPLATVANRMLPTGPSPLPHPVSPKPPSLQLPDADPEGEAARRWRDAVRVAGPVQAPIPTPPMAVPVPVAPPQVPMAGPHAAPAPAALPTVPPALPPAAVLPDALVTSVSVVPPPQAVPPPPAVPPVAGPPSPAAPVPGPPDAGMPVAGMPADVAAPPLTGFPPPGPSPALGPVPALGPIPPAPQQAPAGSWPHDLAVDPSRPASTIVPNRRGGLRRARKEGGRRPDQQGSAPSYPPAPQQQAAEERPPEYGNLELDEAERSRLLSVIVFWAPAMILLILAAVVIWVVR